MKQLMSLFWLCVGVVALTILIGSIFDYSMPRYYTGLSLCALVLAIATLISINIDNDDE